MKHEIKIDLIDPNPHRDLERNPINQKQVDALVASMNRTGFWNNLVVRPMGDRYQLAYGHNRLAALRQANVNVAGFEVRELSDYDMLNCMIDENNTQGKMTPTTAMENVIAALRLGERMLNACGTVEEFNAMLAVSRGVLAHHGGAGRWREDEFKKAKGQIASGEGLGRRFLKHFLPGRPMDDHMAQTAIETHYAPAREALAEAERLEKERVAAEKAEEERQAIEREREETRKAEEERKAKARAAAQAERLEAERRAAAEAAKDEEDAKRKAELEAEAKAKAEEAQRAHQERKARDEAAAEAESQAKAAKAKAEAAAARRIAAEKAAAKAADEAEEAACSGVDRALLERFKSTTAANMVAGVIKRERIPRDWHEAFVNAALSEGWSASRTANGMPPNSIEVKGPAWWNRVNPAAIKARKKEREQIKRAKVLQFKPISVVIDAVTKALGNIYPLRTVLESGDAPLYRPDELIPQIKRLRDHAALLLQAADIMEKAAADGVIDVRAENIPEVLSIEHQEETAA